MTDPRHAPVDDLLAGLRVPSLPADIADRVVAEAGRPGRVPALATPPLRRAHRRRWTRRGVWTTVLAINLVVASAVAAALGTGAVSAPGLIAAARHAVARLVHPGGAAPRPPIAHAPAPAARRPAAAARPEVPRPRVPVAPAPERAPVARPIGSTPSSLRDRPRVHGPQRLQPGRAPGPHPGPARQGWRGRALQRQAADQFGGSRGFGAERPRADAEWDGRFGRPRFDGPRFNRPRFARQRFGPARFGRPRLGGGGRFRPWRGGGRGGPRRRF